MGTFITAIDGNGITRALHLPDFGDASPSGTNEFPNSYYNSPAEAIQAWPPFDPGLTYIARTTATRDNLIALGFSLVFVPADLGNELTLSNGSKIALSDGGAISCYDANNTYLGGYTISGTTAKTLPSFYQTLWRGATSSYCTLALSNVSSTRFYTGISAIEQVWKAGGTGTAALENGETFWNGVKPAFSDTDPYSEIDGESEITGGGTVSIPGFPGLTATSTGIVGLFAPSAAQMQQLADFMWTDFGGTGTDITGVLSEIVEALKRLISNPLDYILGLNIIPSQGLSIGNSSTIKFGFVSSGVSMPRLSNQYFTVDCGTLSFDAVCGDTFLDYAPYSKFSIYLPYIGFREVDANDFVGHTIGVVYHGDVVTGGLTAYITKDESVMYQFSGSCALNIPLSSDNWGSTLSAAVNIATTVIAGATTGGAAGAAKAAAMGAASVAANPSLLSPQVAHSGAVSGAAGAMGVQYPFIIREAVRFHSTEYFNTLKGYPSFYFRSLADVSGYTKVLDLHLENIPATRDEIAEIESILKEGAIF